MCGIVSIIRFDGHSASRMTARRYLQQKTRGQSGYGYVAINRHTGKIDVHRAKTEHEILPVLAKENEATMILFHHRAPTSSPNYEEQTHPIKVSDDYFEYDYYVAHNGIIHNTDKLKEAHEKLEIEYTTEMAVCHVDRENKKSYYYSSIWNDSESLATELALFIEGKVAKVEARGSIAFILYQVNKKTQTINAVFYGRNYQNPLKIEKTDSFTIIASEGRGDTVEPNKLHKYDPLKGEVSSVDLELDNYAVRDYRYSHYDKDDHFPYDKEEDDFPTQLPITNRLGDRDVVLLPTPDGGVLDTSTEALIKDAVKNAEYLTDDDIHLKLVDLYDLHDDLKKQLEIAKSHNNEEEIDSKQFEMFGIEYEIEKLEKELDTREYNQSFKINGA